MSRCCCSPTSPVAGCRRLGAYVGLIVVGAVLITAGHAGLQRRLARRAGDGGRRVPGAVQPECSAPRSPAPPGPSLLTFILPVTVIGIGRRHPVPAGRLGHRRGAGGAAGDPGLAAARSRQTACAGLRGLRRAGPATRPDARTASGRPDQAIRRRPHARRDTCAAPTVSEHDVPAGRPDHRQSAADAAARPAGMAAGGRRPRSRPTPHGWPPVDDRPARRVRRGAAGERRGVGRSRAPADLRDQGAAGRLRCAIWISHRAKISSFLQVVAAAPPGVEQTPVDPDLLRPAIAHELAYTVHLAGHTVSVSAAADARPLLDRLLGRQAPGVGGRARSPPPIASRPVTSPGTRCGSRTACAAPSG